MVYIIFRYLLNRLTLQLKRWEKIKDAYMMSRFFKLFQPDKVYEISKTVAQLNGIIQIAIYQFLALRNDI